MNARQQMNVSAQTRALEKVLPSLVNRAFYEHIVVTKSRHYDQWKITCTSSINDLCGGMNSRKNFLPGPKGHKNAQSTC